MPSPRRPQKKKPRVLQSCNFWYCKQCWQIIGQVAKHKTGTTRSALMDNVHGLQDGLWMSIGCRSIYQKWVQVACKGRDLMELQGLQWSGWSIGILKERSPESLRREAYWQEYCPTMRVPPGRNYLKSKHFACLLNGPKRFLCNLQIFLSNFAMLGSLKVDM